MDIDKITPESNIDQEEIDKLIKFYHTPKMQLDFIKSLNSSNLKSNKDKLKIPNHTHTLFKDNEISKFKLLKSNRKKYHKNLRWKR